MTIFRGTSSATAVRPLLLAPLLAIVCLALASGPASARTQFFSRPFTLGHPRMNDVYGGAEVSGGYRTSAAANDRGDLIVAWTAFPRHNREDVQIAFRPAHGEFTTARTIFSTRGGRRSPRVAIGDPLVAIDGAGNALVVFTEFTLGRHQTVKAAAVKAIYRLARGRLGRAQTLSPAGSNDEAPAVAMAASGEAVVVFQRDLPSSHSPLNSLDYPPVPDLVMAAVRAPGRRFGPATAISPPSTRQTESFFVVPLAPSVVITASGEAIAAWSRVKHDSVAIETSTRPPGGAFGPASRIGTGDGYNGAGGSDFIAIQPVGLADDPSGDTVLAWRSPSPSPMYDYPQLDASYRQAGKPFSTPQVLDPAVDTFSVAVDNLGTAAVLEDHADQDPAGCGGGGGLSVSRHPAGGEFGPAEELLANGGPFPGIVAYGPDRFISTWQDVYGQPDGGPSHDQCMLSYGDLSFATGSATSAFGEPSLLSTNPSAGLTSLVGTPSGLLLAVFNDRSTFFAKFGGPVR